LNSIRSPTFSLVADANFDTSLFNHSSDSSTLIPKTGVGRCAKRNRGTSINCHLSPHLGKIQPLTSTMRNRALPKTVKIQKGSHPIGSSKMQTQPISAISPRASIATIG
jgi:hypothetical protein